MARVVKARLGSLATRDLATARDYYAKIDPELSTRFRDSFDLVVDRLELFPHGAPPVEGFPGVRRARMKTFPYGVFYRVVDSEHLEVLRVLHSARSAEDLDG